MLASGEASPTKANNPRLVSAADLPLTIPPAQPCEDYEDIYGTKAGLIVDLGSFNTRMGWSMETDPRLVYDSVVTKYRERGAGGSGRTHVLLAGSLAHSTITGKSNLKSPFDTHVINTIEYAEHLLDYGFLNLGINSDSINHPIVMTEPPGNSVTSRNSMTELLFEGYGVPQLTYGLDSLFSYYENNQGSMDQEGLIISSGNHATHVLPVFGGKGRIDLASRINYGGHPAADFMLKSLQLKYPSFPVKMTFPQAQSLVHSQTFFSDDYIKTLRQIGPENDLAKFQEMDVTVQFPFIPPAQGAVEADPANEELLAKRRKEQGDRLRAHVEKQRREKLAQREIELENLKDLKASKAMTNKAAFLRLLMDYDLETEAELDTAIQTAENSIKKVREKMLGIEPQSPPPAESKREFPLLEIPDDELSEDSKREKRKQRLLKAGIDARERARQAKQQELDRLEELAKKEEEFRLNDFDGWLAELRGKRESLVTKIKERNKLKDQLMDRRSTASQLRMRSIANLAREVKLNSGSSNSGLKRSRNSAKSKANNEDDDNFGANDNDWSIYREINKKIGEDSEEEDDTTQLAQLDAQLLEFDPDYQPGDDPLLPTSYRSLHSNSGTEHGPSFLQRYQFGLPATESANATSPAEDLKVVHQLHVNVERIRIPEVLFQPSIIGLDQGGLDEVIGDGLFKRIDHELQLKLLQNIHLTGGFSQVPGFTNRLDSILRAITPYPTSPHPDAPYHPIQIRMANHPQLDSWRGAARFYRNQLTNQSAFLTREEYLECGNSYSIDHGMGNWV